MGRPLNKKYFGNRNIGSTSTTADDKIGGEGVESISVATAGSFVVTNTYKNFPLLNIGAPDLPGGVHATADVVFELNTVTFASGGQTNSDYVAGLSTSITGLGGGAIVNITEVANKVTAVDVTTAGTNRGEFRRGDFDGTGITTHQVLQAPNAGTDLQITVTYRVKSITMLEKGSGYTAVPVLSWSGHTFTGQTTPSGNTPALTTEQTVGGNQYASQSGAQNVASYDENAILIYAKTTSGGTSLLGDIVSQKGRSVFKIKTTDGTANCLLKASAVSAAGECTITATDSDNGTYFVTKISSHRCTVVPGTGSQFVTGQSVPWTFGTASAGASVKIPNA